MARIVFMGTPDFAVPSLQTLIDQFEVIGVVSQPDRPAGRGQKFQKSPVKSLATAAGIPVYQPESLRSDSAIVPIREWAPDIIVVAAFGQLLKKNLLDLPPKGCLNVHASLLPRWRGAAPIQYTILAGDTESGVSLMQMDEGLDTGPVYIQKRIALGKRETATTLHNRLAELGGTLLNDHLEAIMHGRMPVIAQDDSMATYAPTLKKDAGHIDWSQPATQIDRLVRAMNPWPTAFTSWQGKRLKILDASPLVDSTKITGRPGQVIPIPGTAGVVTGQGVLQINQLQLAGKRSMGIVDFLRGQPDFITSLLTN